MVLGSAFAVSVARHPGAEAVVDGTHRRTYAQWDGDIRAAAGALARMGLASGDHFAVVMRNRPVNTWRYEFRPTDDGGADVTESFDLGDNLWTRIWRPLGGFMRERRNQRDMLRTLERVKAVAEKP